ncbi:CG0192-related protein [Nocardiopsis synnemataformans]|uniref:CG0192-related protein n=1 Tax=Nocardiopsis synnemataformans TaxID=61305 RepID=UPI003EC01114
MAIIYKADLTPSKPELIGAWLDGQPWAGPGPDEALGAYRFDDPEGEVGVEVFLLRRGDRLLHVPLTYRGAPLPGHEDHLVGTLEHSVLGTRWVYDGTEDEVSLACFRRALTGEQEQAELEVWEDGRVRERRPQQVVVSREVGAAGDGTGPAREGRVLVRRVLDGEPEGRPRLLARWGGQQAVVAALV